MTKASTLSYFQKKIETRIIADASPIGLRVVLQLTQLHDRTLKIVSYASRSLTEIEQKYSQTEKEALALFGHVNDSTCIYLVDDSNLSRNTNLCNTSIQELYTSIQERQNLRLE